MKTVGIIGGFGPEATAQFYLALTARVRSRVLVRHVLCPRKLEHDALVLGKNLEKFEPLLVEAAKKLEEDGADIIVLPCNTLHMHEDAIRKAIRVPFISIIEETSKQLRKKRVKKVGLLGSRVTVKNNLFKKKASLIKFATIPKNEQRQLDNALDMYVDTQNSNALRKVLIKSFELFNKKGIKNVLIACTDFHGLCPTTSKTHDTLDILVRSTVSML